MRFKKSKLAEASSSATMSFTWTISGLALAACGGGGGGGGVSYFHSEKGVTVSLAGTLDSQGFITGHSGGEAAGDKLKNFEKLEGSHHDDMLTGNDEDNLLTGQNGNDTLNGEDGEDRLYGDSGNDKLYGGDHDDTLYGGSGDDELYGGDQDDSLIGGSGVNMLDGGEGDDNIFADNGRAIMTGGAGSDVFAIGYIASTIEDACVITDFSINDDWLDFSALINAFWIDQSQSVTTGQDSNDSTRFDTVLYADENRHKVVLVIEDYIDDIASGIGDTTIEIHEII